MTADQVRKLINVWTPLVGTEPRDSADSLAHLGPMITAMLSGRYL